MSAFYEFDNCISVREYSLLSGHEVEAARAMQS